MPDRLEHHPAADLFPMMSDERSADLRESIRFRGLLDDIVLYDGKILDGRNRYNACMELGLDLEGRFKTHTGNPFKFSWDKNGNRRDLVNDQRSVIFVLSERQSEDWEAAQAQAQAAATRRRSDAARAQPRSEDGTRLAAQVPPQLEGAPAGEASQPTDATPPRRARNRNGSPGRPTQTAAAMATQAGTSRSSIERATRLVDSNPDLARQVAQGTMRPTAAQRELRRAAIATRVEPFPDGKHRVIYADPPWQYSDSREGLGSGDNDTPGAATRIIIASAK